jgi:hypothetical protein
MSPTPTTPKTAKRGSSDLVILKFDRLVIRSAIPAKKTTAMHRNSTRFSAVIPLAISTLVVLAFKPKSSELDRASSTPRVGCFWVVLTRKA